MEGLRRMDGYRSAATLIPSFIYFTKDEKKTIATGIMSGYAINSCGSATSCLLQRASGVTHVERRLIVSLHVSALQEKCPGAGLPGHSKEGVHGVTREQMKLHSGRWRICDINHQMGNDLSRLTESTILINMISHNSYKHLKGTIDKQ